MVLRVIHGWLGVWMMGVLDGWFGDCLVHSQCMVGWNGLLTFDTSGNHIVQCLLQYAGWAAK